MTDKNPASLEPVLLKPDDLIFDRDGAHICEWQLKRGDTPFSESLSRGMVLYLHYDRDSPCPPFVFLDVIGTCKDTFNPDKQALIIRVARPPNSHTACLERLG